MLLQRWASIVQAGRTNVRLPASDCISVCLNQLRGSVMLASYISNIATRVTGGASCSGRPWDFQCYLRDNQDAGTVLQLPEVLLQVYKYLDSKTLYTSVPLVCKQWRTTAADWQLWTLRLPEHVVIVATTYAEATAAGSDTADCHYAVTKPSIEPSVNWPLLHQAIYSKNLLRNPEFIQSQNLLHFILPRLRAASQISSTEGAGCDTRIQCSVISNEQRRLAWVNATTAPDCVTWQSPPLGIHSSHISPPPPKPYPSYKSSSNSSISHNLPHQLQRWWQSTTGLMFDQTVQLDQGIISCLATGNSWGEVVQVVDLLEELVMRGLAPSLAAVLLDSGALGLGLSLWAASPDDSDNSSVCDVAESNTTPGPSQSSHSSHSSSSNGEAAGAADNSPASAVAGRAAVVDAAMAVMRVALMLDDGRVSLKSFQTFVRRDSSHHFISQRVVLLPGAWKRYTYVLRSCPRGCRRAVVLLRGRGPLQGAAAETCNTLGSYNGVKFASAELIFVKQQDMACWQKGSQVLV